MKKLYTFILYFKDFVIKITELIQDNLWLKILHVLVVSQFGDLFLNVHFHLNIGRYMDNSKLSCYNCTELCDQAHIFFRLSFLKNISKLAFVFFIFSLCVIIAQK